MLNQSSKKKFENEQQVYVCALNLLNIRDYGGAEMLARLLRRGAERSAAEAVVARLRACGYIDEQRYARQVYQAWLAKKYYGRLHLQAEMRKKQVDEAAGQAMLAEFTEELEAAHAAAAAGLFRSTHARQLAAQLPREKICAAAARFMAARGFTGKYLHELTDTLHFTEDI